MPGISAIAEKLKSNTTQQVIGLMSGTSLDGLDIALVEFKAEQANLEINLISGDTYHYSPAIRASLAHARGDTINQLAAQNFELGQLHCKMVEKFISDNKIDPASVLCVATHGHTIVHQHLQYSLQIGAPDYIAKRLQLPVTFDFRSADIAMGGSGAPLVPILEQCLLKENEVAVFQNLGGIANLSYFAKNQLFATDIAPANMISNYLIAIDSGRELFFDKDGQLSQTGSINNELLAELEQHSFTTKGLPKSTGADDFGFEYCQALRQRYSALKLEDMLFTANSFCARQTKKVLVDLNVPAGTSIYLSGGGIYNQSLMNLLMLELNAYSLQLFSTKFNIADDYKEAVCFALLGYLCLQGRKSKIGTSAGTVLGKIQLPD